MTDGLARSLQTRFTTHDLSRDQILTCEDIRRQGLDLSLYLAENCPESPELRNALDRLDETVMWANASIARNGV
jgi:hypothetical protein